MTIELPQVEYCILSIPEPHILLVTINRPKQFNALHLEANQELGRVFDWAEDNQEIWCSVVWIIYNKFNSLDTMNNKRLLIDHRHRR